MFRKSLMAAIALTFVVFTSGCMKFNMDLTVNKDDTVEGSMVVAFSNSALGLMGGGNPLDTADLGQDQPGVTTMPYEDSEYTGTKVTFEPKKFSEFSTGATGEELSFKRDGDIVTVSGAINLNNGEIDTTQLEEYKSNPLTSYLFENMDITVSITLPGKVTSKTGTVSGNTVTFKGDLGEKIVIDATSDQSTASNMPGVIAFSAIAAALLGLGAFAVIRSRKAKAEPAVVDQFPTE
ncbi:MAG: hypothetical protein EBU08_09685 [Micrococcales bacterium]|nr:hypothetical protein [Micrococcales bacterium]NBX95006.1 hypothetical protein [Actinomycetota bacterium]